MTAKEANVEPAAANHPPPSTEAATTLLPSPEVVIHTFPSAEAFPRPPLPSSPTPSTSRLGVCTSTPSTSSMSLAWYWLIETLASCKQVNAYILRDLIFSAPDFFTGAPGPVRERVALRYLEELASMVHSNGPPACASTSGIDMSQSCEEVLCCEMWKYRRIARSNLEKATVDPLTPDIQKFILQKRNSLAVTSLEKIKADLAKENCLHLMSLKKKHDLPVQNANAYPQRNKDDEYQRVDNLKSIPNSADLAPGNCIGLLQQEHTRSMEQLLNIVELDKMVQRDNVKTGGNDKKNSDFTENERFKKIKLSTEEQVGKSCFNVVNADNDPSVRADITAMGGYNSDLVEDALTARITCNEDGHLQHAPQNGHGKISIFSFNKKIPSNVQIRVAPDVARDGNPSYDVHSDVGSDDDAFSAEKHQFLSSQINFNDDSAIDDYTERHVCIKCNKGDNILICSGCLISVHETCIGSSLTFDALGHFICPICSYARVAIEYKKAKKKFSQARKNRSVFIRSDFVRGYQQNGSLSGVQAEAIQAIPVESSQSKLNVMSNQEARDKQHETLIEDNKQTHQVEIAHPCDNYSSPCRKAETLVSETIINTSNPSAEADNDVIVAEADNDIIVHDVHSDTANQEIALDNNSEQANVAEHQQQGEPSINLQLNSSAHPCHDRYGKDVVHGEVSLINEHLNVQQWSDLEEDDHDTLDSESTGEEHGNKLEDASAVNNRGNSSSLSKSKRHDIRAKRFTNPILPGGRRRKLPWTKEEEEILKEAYDKLDKTHNANISWVKVLEYGCHVFHRTRQPGDLKDKWRNMKKREASSSRNT